MCCWQQLGKCKTMTLEHTHTYIYIYMYIYMYMYVCACMYGFIYLCVCLYVLLIPSLCIYIYVYRDSEREKERSTCTLTYRLYFRSVWGIHGRTFRSATCRGLRVLAQCPEAGSHHAPQLVILPLIPPCSTTCGIAHVTAFSTCATTPP